MTAGASGARRRAEPPPETVDASPGSSPQEIEPEANPFTSRDWRMLAYAWTGFLLRGLIVVGAVFSAYQYLEARREKRVERTLELIELWERTQYQDAQQAIAARLDALNLRYSGMLGPNPNQSERAVYYEQVGLEAMSADGGDMPLPQFRAHFDRMVYFLNRMAFCVDGNLCSREMVDAYFGDFALSFWDYFRSHVERERRQNSPNFAMPIESYVARLRAEGR